VVLTYYRSSVAGIGALRVVQIAGEKDRVDCGNNEWLRYERGCCKLLGSQVGRTFEAPSRSEAGGDVVMWMYKPEPRPRVMHVAKR
jgi:hypothetical protein